MNAFHLAGVSAPQPLPRWLPQAGALLAAGAVALFACRLPILHTVSWGELIGSAVACVLEVILASALAVWGICAISSRTIALNTSLILRTSLAALWIAPLVLLIRENSPWVIVLAAVLVTGVVKSVRLPQQSSPPDFQETQFQESFSDPIPNPFRLLESAPSFRWQAFGGAATLCAEAGIGAALAGYAATGALLVGTAAAVYTWSYTRNESPHSLLRAASSRSSSRAVWRISLAIVITAAALLPYLPHSFGMGGFGAPSHSHAHRAFPQAESGGQRSRDKTFEASTGRTTEGDAGIVLSPEKLIHTKLVAPAPIIINAPQTGHRSASPLAIPFDGVYWFFKTPDLHPPQSSRQAHGTPELLDIHSTDRRPLSMEAHDNLGTLISLDCCSKIQIAIRNADPYSDTVSLELILIDSTLPGKPSQSLGRVVVKSRRTWNLYGEHSLTREELNFAIPENPAIHHFDEVNIIFRLAAFRADDGPKIAIDHLVLFPRGL